MSLVTLEQIRDMSRFLSPDDKLRLIDDLVHQLLDQPAPAPARKTSFRSLWGALADLGPAPSEEDIDAMRREVFASFPCEEYETSCGTSP
jgi:hypothetical protein